MRQEGILIKVMVAIMTLLERTGSDPPMLYGWSSYAEQCYSIPPDCRPRAFLTC